MAPCARRDRMPESTSEITIPEIKVDLENLLELIRRLDASARRRVAQVLADSEMDERLGELIRQLAAKPPVDDLSDKDIDHEIKKACGASSRPR